MAAGSPPASPIVMERPPQPRVVHDPAPTRSLLLHPASTPHPPLAPDSLRPPVVNRIKIGHGWVSPPDPDSLSFSNSTGPWYVAEGSKPDILVGTMWRCPVCKELYEAVYNLLANTPVFECKKQGCNVQNISSYSWTITRVILNNILLDFPLLYAQEENMCVLYSFIALCDLLRMLRGARYGWYEPSNLCVATIPVIYEEVHGYAFGQEPDWYHRCYGRIENVFTCMCLKGVPFRITKFQRFHPEVPQGSLKLKCWFRIQVQQVEKITRLLANGIPLIGVMPPGVLFRYVKAKQIYHAPRSSKARSLHAVVLHGSGYEAPKGTFYRCRDSGGPSCHGYYELKDTGGDFEVWSSDFVGFVYGCELA